MTTTAHDPDRDAPSEANVDTDEPRASERSSGEVRIQTTRIERLRLFSRRQPWGPLLGVAVLSLIIGLALGRWSAPETERDARRALEASVLGLALEADAIWTAGNDSRGPVSEALVALRRDGDPGPARADLDAWLESYDVAMVRIAGVDLPTVGRPVQRQFIAALTLSRDAVEVLGHAARVDDELARRDLTTEVGRLRQRSEQLFQRARASMADLDGGRTDIGPLPPVRSFQEGRRP